MALLKSCKCGNKIEYQVKLCVDCIEDRKMYDRDIRYSNSNKKYADFYRNKGWVRTREVILSNYKGLDLYDYYINKKITYANTVHHIEELKENWDRRLDMANLIPLSQENHSFIHKLYEKDKEKTKKLLFNLLERWKVEQGWGV